MKNKFQKDIDYNIWIITSSNNKKFNYNSKYFFEYVINNIKEIDCYYIIDDKVKRESLNERYGKEYFIESESSLVNKAGVWITSAGLPKRGLRLNSKRLVVNLWHGVPLKKILLLEENYGFLKRMVFPFLVSNNYDYIATTSQKLRPIMAESFGVDVNKVKVLGQPRNDLLFKDNSIFFNKLVSNLPKFKKAILYAPTFRDNEKTKLFPFEEFEIKKMNDFLEVNDYMLFIRTHQDEKLNDSLLNAPRISILNEDVLEDSMEVLNCFDLLITDYSSIYIDFLLTLKPIVFLPYDLDVYTKARGLNFDYKKVTPGPKPIDFKSFIEEISLLLNQKEYYLEQRIHMSNFFNEVQAPCSADIVEFIKDKAKEKEHNLLL